MKELKKYLTSNIEIEKEFAEKLLKNEHIFSKIFEVCNNQFVHGCGSYLFDGQKYNYDERMFEKQLLLYSIAKKSKRALEIGTYMGHSLLIMLIANPNLEITSIDIDKTYAESAINYLNQAFDTKIKFLHGDSTTVLPKLNEQYDLFHIDGTHELKIIYNELLLCQKLASSDTINIIFDDYHTIMGIENKIENTHEILEKIIPGCIWSNCYLKIKSLK